jgi:hypothetical protein
VVRMYIVWIVVLMGFFVRNLMFYLHIYYTAAVGVSCGVLVSLFCNPWRRCVDVLVVGVGMKYYSLSHCLSPMWRVQQYSPS